ncbi:MAG TPA: hypothetical protein VJQ54_08445, partial [Candidatus Sulfotelmatobacter sp.]|nr:hypothetical protein [Candidatus Sulfotelmatobacter sp.]
LPSTAPGVDDERGNAIVDLAAKLFEINNLGISLRASIFCRPRGELNRAIPLMSILYSLRTKKKFLTAPERYP